jgi:hypothetical protein
MKGSIVFFHQKISFMKRKFFGLAAVVLALSLSAFTLPKRHNAKFGNYYWFPLDSGGVPLPASVLYYQSWDPSGCTFLGEGGYCEGAFTSYALNPAGGQVPYSAAGFWVTIDYMDY